MLAEHMLARIAEEEGREAAALESAAAEVLRTYSWPGNVRQLENTIRQLILMESAAFIQGSSVSRIITGTEVAASQEERGQRVTSREVISDKGIEPLWLTERKAIEACNGSINRAARYLEVAPSTIYRKIQSWKAQDA